MFGLFGRKRGKTEEPSLGARAVQEIAETWAVEERDTERLSDGFVWWPGHFRVEVRYDDLPADSDGDQSRISIETEYLEDIPADDPKFVCTLAQLGQFSSGYCFWFLPTVLHEQLEHEGPVKLTLVSTAYVNRDQLEWLPPFLAAMAIMQPISAEAHASTLCALLGGRVAYAPRNRVREPVRRILGIATDLYVPAGVAPSWWSDTDEFERFANTYGRRDRCFGFGQRDMMTLETPFGSNSALLSFLSSQPHPQLGNGLLVSIQLPFRSTSEAEIADKAALLNCWETIRSTGIPQLGCWHSRMLDDESYELAHTTFVPNKLAQPGIATNLAFWSLNRARWARHKLWPDLKDLTMAEILSARTGGHASS